ncbi:MAG: type I-A CRISPR-associated protein Cas7/Csa2 [Candidatus Nezhaarchaeales archaeon]
MYIRISGRAIVNVHSANAEGAVGAYVGLSRMPIVRRTAKGYEISEEPVISGNMLKHWHAVAVTDLLLSTGSSDICDLCKQHIMFRSPHNYPSEFDYIDKCSIEDLHGFLDPRSNVRRESLVKFSFMIPIEELTSATAAITHNRVVLTPKGKSPSRDEAKELWGTEEAAAMMVFKREHASGVYGFACSMDLAYVGRSICDPSKKIDDNRRRSRARAAILGLMNVISGQVGASQSRALPAIKATELIGLASIDPAPNVIHGFYSDYVENSAELIKAWLSAHSSNPNRTVVVATEGRPLDILMKKDLPKEFVIGVKSAEEGIAKIAELVDKWLK